MNKLVDGKVIVSVEKLKKMGDKLTLPSIDMTEPKRR
jgi:hypothetical protein